MENGVVTAVGAGKAVVTASTANGKSASCQLEVRGASSSSLKLSSKELSLTAGNSALLTANAAVSWSSSDPSVAAVTSGGRVEAKKPGSAAITARAADGSTATCTVFVSAGNTAGDVQSILNSAPLNPTRTGVAAVDELVDRIFDEIFTPGMTTYEKTRAIYDYLVDNITYGRGSKYWTDYISLLGGRTYSSRDREVILRAYDILISDVGVCNDYSAAFMVMTRAVGLECFYVEGKTNNISGGYSGHIWNNIRINGTLYTFDVQVEANITDRAGGVNTYTRFCKTDAQMGSKLIYFRRQADIDAYNGLPRALVAARRKEKEEGVLSENSDRTPCVVSQRRGVRLRGDCYVGCWKSVVLGWENGFVPLCGLHTKGKAARFCSVRRTARIGRNDEKAARAFPRGGGRLRPRPARDGSCRPRRIKKRRYL